MASPYRGFDNPDTPARLLKLCGGVEVWKYGGGCDPGSSTPPNLHTSILPYLQIMETAGLEPATWPLSAVTVHIRPGSGKCLQTGLSCSATELRPQVFSFRRANDCRWELSSQEITHKLRPAHFGFVWRCGSVEVWRSMLQGATSILPHFHTSARKPQENQKAPTDDIARQGRKSWKEFLLRISRRSPCHAELTRVDARC